MRRHGFGRVTSLGLLSAALGAALLAGAAQAADASGAAGCSMLVGRPDGSGADGRGAEQPLALQHAAYDVEIMGSVALGTFSLEFVNDGSVDLVAACRGRGPAGLELSSLGVRVGDEQELELAAARPSGAAGTPQRTARRPGPSARALPTFAVPAGETVVVRGRFQHDLTFKTDRFRMVLPAPARLVSAPVPTGVSVTLHHDEPLVLAESPSHDVLVRFEGIRSVIELVVDDAEGDRPFELEYALGREEEAVLKSFASPEQDGTREVLVVLAPPTTTREESVRSKEVLFVLDTSGSMKDAKIEQARAAIAYCLNQMGPEDHLNLVEFDAKFSVMAEEPVASTPDAVETAMAWLARQRAAGATRLLPALAAAFEQAHEPGLHRMVILLTDGMVQDAKEVQRFLEERLGEARLFVVGIGENAKPETIRLLAESGRGTAAFATEPEQLETTMRELFDGISAPVVWDLQLDWGGATVVEMTPRRLPDLYAGRPVTVRAKVRGELPPDLLMTGSTMDGERSFSVALPPAGATEYPELRTGQEKTAPAPRRRR